jgi:formate hydrogenlyase subunit 3/multisubunit Na+/H+ antiporter MnhD subunit
VQLAIALGGVAAFLALAVIAVAMGRSPAASRIVYACSLVVAALLLTAAATALTSAASAQTVALPFGVPWLGAHFRLDALSAVFVCVVAVGAAGASLFAIGYGQHEHAPQRVLPFFPAFLAGMTLVVLADDAFSFLVSWEFMSLMSWALVIAHDRDPDNVRAGYIYLVMAGFGTLTLLLAFGLLAGADGHYSFAQMRAAHPATATAALVLILALTGAGSKAGLVPLHAWLPLAHPAAPSHVSALMSGVMTKVAIYGFVRIVFDLAGDPAWWWSMIVLALGGATAVLGVLYAVMQRDLKRLLAYSTVENVGIIFIGLGLALAFKAHGMLFAAALAFTAALFHAFNHTLFKSLLFFGAGAVLSATGERDMERLGGLIHGMPRTAFVVLVGAMAIAALPPLNGFVSEWLTLQAILLSPQLPSWGLKLLVPAVGALLALSAALAAACFVRGFGISFLGRPRSDAAAAAHETDFASLAAMYLFAGLCLLAGILPGLFIDTVAPVSTALIGAHMPAQLGSQWLTIVPVAASRSSYDGLLVFAFMMISGGLAAWVIHRFASDRLRRAPAWDCGYPDPSPTTQYSAASFAQPIRRVFGTVIFRAREDVDMPPPGATRPAYVKVQLTDPIWDYVYAPLIAAVGFATERLNRLQFLTIRQFLSLVFGALIVLLLVLAIWS